MMMYERLVKNLRDDTALQNCEFDFVRAWMHEAADAIEDLIVALTASNEVIAKSKHQWIPATERLPKRMERVLVYSKIKGVTTDFICNDGSGWYGSVCVTHWTPLPQLPDEE